jgi:hypothetical protein
MNEPKGGGDKGCLIVGVLFAVGVVAGAVLLLMNDKGSLAFLVALIGGLAFFMAKPWKPVTPEEQRALHPAGSDEALVRTLERLGIPLDFGTATPQEALIGGLAKTAIFRGAQALEERRWDDAGTSLGSAIKTLSNEPGPRWDRVLAVAHRLRGNAYEGASRPKEALADYERALVLIPDEAEAKAGKKRLSPPS